MHEKPKSEVPTPNDDGIGEEVEWGGMRTVGGKRVRVRVEWWGMRTVWGKRFRVRVEDEIESYGIKLRIFFISIMTSFKTKELFT